MKAAVLRGDPAHHVDAAGNAVPLGQAMKTSTPGKTTRKDEVAWGEGT